MPTCELVMPFICMVICKTRCANTLLDGQTACISMTCGWPRAGPHRFQPLGQLSSVTVFGKAEEW